jgi:hypothetical protein
MLVRQSIRQNHALIGDRRTKHTLDLITLTKEQRFAASPSSQVASGRKCGRHIVSHNPFDPTMAPNAGFPL